MNPVNPATVSEQAVTSEVRRLSTLLESSRALSSTLDIKASLHLVLEILSRHHGAVRSLIVLLDSDTGELQLEASDGLNTPVQARYACLLYTSPSPRD